MERFKKVLCSIIRKGGVIFAFLAVSTLFAGAASNPLTDGEKIKLVDEWAEQNNYETYTVSCRDSRTWLISAQEDDSYPIIPKRIAQEVHFSGNEIESVDAFHTGTVIDCADSLESFKILFDNELGLPDVASLKLSLDAETQTINEPISMLKMTLQLDSACKIEGGTEYAIREQVDIKDKPDDVKVYMILFPDFSKAKVTVLHEFLIHDWTDENSENDRSAVDITSQFARGVKHKSGQYVYPILSTKLQGEMIDYQKHGSEEWYWKLGGSSPSYRDFIVLPTEKANTCTVVFQKYGGGMNDYRAAYAVTTGKQNNRTVITNVKELTPKNYTYSELFQFYYHTGLDLPTAEDHDLDSFYNTGTYRDLLQPDTAAPVLFSYCNDDTGFIPDWFSVDAVSEDAVPDKTGSITCTIHLKFKDNSTPVIVQMKKTGDFWLPIDIVNAEDITLNTFADIPADAYYVNAVQWAIKQGVATGTSATTFSPDTPCTNGQILTFLWRANHSPESTITSPFTDVKSTDYYYKTSLWAAEKGLLSGSRFNADAPCTRAMTMKYLWKIAGSPTAPDFSDFTDVPVNASYAQAVAWAVRNGVTTGTSATAFSPNTICTRAQVITFIYRAVKK